MFAPDDPVVLRVLELARRRVGLDVAWVSELADGREVYRCVEGDAGRFGIVAGASTELDVLRPDGAGEALLTATVRAGVGVPIRCGGPQPVGMLCCAGATPGEGLRDADIRYLELLATVLADHLGDPAEELERFGDVRAEVGALVGTGPAIVFQPIVDLRSGRVLGAEALSRFPDGECPARWFERAASVGLGPALELSAVRAALPALDEVPPGAYLSVNASPALVESGRLVALLGDAAATRLVVEVTERATVGDSDAFIAGLAGLRALGVRIAVADVGADVASFEHVLRVRPDILKLDRSLTRGVGRDPGRRALVIAAVAFARDVGAVLVAEGVEVQAELDALVALGVGAAQGFLLARPAPLPLAVPALRPGPGIGGGAPVRGTFERVAEAWRAATDLETLVRPLLDAVLDLTGLEVAYVTVKHDEGRLEHRFVADPGGLGLPEGLTVPWDESTSERCRDAGLRWTEDVPRDLPGSPAAEALGVQTFLSVPLVSSDGALLGTLCGASLEARYVSAATLAELEVLARLLGDWMVRDIAVAAERHRSERAAQAVAARTRLLARAEHQLKTPLTLVAGWAMTLEERWDELPDDARRGGLAALRSGAERLGHDLRRLLDEARADVRVRSLDLCPVDLGAVARAATDQLASLSLRHEVSLDADGTVLATADAEALRQVLDHLLDNALASAPDGGAVAVQVRRDGDGAVIAVADEGIGIPEGVDIFAPFTRGGADDARPGTGLGLHIVRTLVTAMGGTVDAVRNVDAGSTFTVRLRHSGL